MIQSGRMWSKCFDKWIQSLGFVQSDHDPCLYTKGSIYDPDFLIVSVYVDDLTVLARDPKVLADFKAALADRFKMVDRGELDWILGMGVSRERDHISIDQSHRITALLQKYSMDQCNTQKVKCPMVKDFLHEEFVDAHNTAPEPPTTFAYAQCVGALLYIALMRPDICYAVNTLARFMARPRAFHVRAVKHLLRYLAHTKHYKLRYYRGEGTPELFMYVDADYANIPRDRVSISGYVAYLSPGSAPISWASRKESLLATSTSQAEYMSAYGGGCETVHLRRMTAEFGVVMYAPTKVHEDNDACMAVANDPVYHKRTKHWEVKHHYIRSLVRRAIIVFCSVPSAKQVADALTKPLVPAVLARFIPALLGGRPTANAPLAATSVAPHDA